MSGALERVRRRVAPAGRERRQWGNAVQEEVVEEGYGVRDFDDAVIVHVRAFRTEDVPAAEQADQDEDRVRHVAGSVHVAVAAREVGVGRSARRKLGKEGGQPYGAGGGNDAGDHVAAVAGGLDIDPEVVLVASKGTSPEKGASGVGLEEDDVVSTALRGAHPARHDESAVARLEHGLARGAVDAREHPLPDGDAQSVRPHQVNVADADPARLGRAGDDISAVCRTESAFSSEPVSMVLSHCAVPRASVLSK